MIAYNPSQPLIGLHVPKCAGSSMKPVLRRWFGRQLYWHYFDERANRVPQRFQSGPVRRLVGSMLGRGFCIYGHFNRARGFGIEDYYPDARQFFTIVRDPLATALPRYFFAKRQASNRYRGGRPAPIADRYASVDLFIADQLQRPYLVNYLPDPLTLENYVEIFGDALCLCGRSRGSADLRGPSGGPAWFRQRRRASRQCLSARRDAGPGAGRRVH